ncbi:hypothetical protein, partial [Alicyclobacillus suci]|uniref:hypothetical protein n=1 Tax=Alicyclobacillus suci TaxID=2816080 RepID=UPI001A8EC2D7
LKNRNYWRQRQFCINSRHEVVALNLHHLTGHYQEPSDVLFIFGVACAIWCEHGIGEQLTI